MNNKVESDITSIMVFLKTISQIKVGQKYNLYDGKFVSSSSIDGAIRRYWNGENRHTLVDELEKTYANAWKIINEGGIGIKYTDLLRKHVIESLIGLDNLSMTYTGDNNISNKLSLLKDYNKIRLEEDKEKMKFD